MIMGLGWINMNGTQSHLVMITYIVNKHYYITYKVTQIQLL